MVGNFKCIHSAHGSTGGDPAEMAVCGNLLAQIAITSITNVEKIYMPGT